MDKFEKLANIGEGSYGVVYKCRVRETGQLVAIKKFSDSEDDPNIKKIATREVSLLKKLKHENLVNMLDVFRRRKRIHIVFEFCETTLLKEILDSPKGLPVSRVCWILWQVLQAVCFCHDNSCIHRDIKPENILVTSRGIVKLCDFGFARMLTGPGGQYTDYVATRWYRAPELLVGDVMYGPPVDVWAIGCVFSELMSGEALWAGRSDVDQLFIIQQNMGDIPENLIRVFQSNSYFKGVSLPRVTIAQTLAERYPKFGRVAISLLDSCVSLEPASRLTCTELLDHQIFEDFAQSARELEKLYQQERDERDSLVKQTLQKDRRQDGAAGGSTLPQLAGAADGRATKSTFSVQHADAEAASHSKPKTKLPSIKGHMMSK